MRRATMTGVPSKYSLGIESSRNTLGEDPRKRQRNVRDKGYQNECMNNVLEFVLAKEYDRPVNSAMLLNPSLKEFQSLFKFIQSFIEVPPESTRKFEEEVMVFLRGIKYPFASEINRSQLIAITPHTWPVLLSMLSWMVSLVQGVERVQESKQNTSLEEESREIFYKYLYREYSAYMEGRDDDTAGELSVEQAMDEMHRQKIECIEMYQENIQRIKKEISQISQDIDRVSELEEKKNQAQTDLEKLTALRKHNEAKHKKYKKTLEESQAQLQTILNEYSEAFQTKTALEEEIKLQPIRPEDVEEMTEERESLIKSMEEIKRSKTTLLREIDTINQQIRLLVDEAEKYIFDLTHIQSSLDINLQIVRKRTITDLLEYDEYEIEGSIEQEHQKAKEFLQNITTTITQSEEDLLAVKEAHSLLQDQQKALLEEIRQKEERIKVHAQVYIEKKEASENEYKQAVGRVDKTESELLKILSEGDNGLFQSEQNLERLKIRKARTLSTISAEEAELQRISSLVSTTLSSLKERINESLASLTITHI
ncbi:kinetochore protein NDC80 [Nematocida sp. AWRm80]|nr:kinetochore protein NDC80 [Nematocida sp. AWRm80]